MQITSVALMLRSSIGSSRHRKTEGLEMIRVRRATPGDIPRMMEIAKRAVTASQWERIHYEQMFLSVRLAMVIEEDALVLGFIVGRGTAGEWEIENIAVSGSGRRRGLGTRLLGEFLHHIRGNGARVVYLEVRVQPGGTRPLRKMGLY